MGISRGSWARVRAVGAATALAVTATVAGLSAPAGAAPPANPIALRGSSTATAGASKPLVVPVPAGAQAGDVLVVGVIARGAPDLFGAPAGWTLLDDQLKGAWMRQATYVHVATASEPASYTWATGKNYSSAGTLLDYSGVNATSPVAASSGAKFGPQTAMTAPSVTSTQDGSVVVAFFGLGAVGTITPAQAMTSRAQVAWPSGGQTFVLDAEDLTQATAGPSGDLTAVASVASYSVDQAIALTPASPSSNTPPVPGPDSLTTLEDTPGQISVATLLANDSPGSGAADAGQTLTVTGVAATAATNGTVALANGTVTYTPAANYNGNAGFAYTVCDNGSPVQCATGSVSTTVTAVNDAPSFTAGPDQTVGAGAGPKTVTGWATALSAGPADESAQALTFLVQGVSNPALFATQPTVASDGTLTFTPGSSAGSSTVTIALQDSGGTANGGQDTSAPQTFTITVSAAPPPPPPTANADAYSVTSGQVLTVAAPGVLGNDSAPSGHAVSATLGSGPAQGTLSLAADGGFTYTPATGFSGTDSFTYTAQDTTTGATSSPATVTITVSAANHPPTLSAIANQSSAEGQTVTVQAQGSDPDSGDTITYAATGLPPGLSMASTTGVISGTVAFGAASGSPYGVTVTVTDSHAASTSRSFTWTVTGSGAHVAALYHMEEAGGSALDASGNGNTGSTTAISYRQPGHQGYCFGFNGSSSIITVPHSASISPGAANFTLSLWLKLSVLPAEDYDIARKGLGSSAGGDFKLEVLNNGQVYMHAHGSTTLAGITAGPNVVDGQWHYLALVKTASDVRLVVDGTSYSTGRKLGSVTNTDPMTIGAQPTGDFTNGLIDEVQLTIG